MRARTALLLVVLVALGLFAALNWAVFTAPTDLNLLFARVQAPLGVILLVVIVAVTLLYAALLVWLETAARREARRAARELEAQRRLAQEAEASRFTELKAFLTAELGELRALPEATARDLTARLERVETALRGDVERAGNTLAAYIGELEERLERAGRASLPPSTQPRYPDERARPFGTGPGKETAMLRSMNALTGFTIGATDGDIGKIEAFYFDDLSFTVRHLVVDTGGWLSGRKVLISPRALGRVDWDGSRVNASLTKAQVESSPAIDTDQPVSRQKEIEYHRYYGYPTYWSGPYLWGGYPLPVMSPDAAMNAEAERRWDWATKERGDPHLRSSAAVIGYHITATDGEIGHVEDFLVDEASWAIRYMVVDTSNWWFGKHLLVSVEWIGTVDWNDSQLHVDLTREQIKSSPEYDASRPVEREYETRLHDYYGRSGYWSTREDVSAGRR